MFIEMTNLCEAFGVLPRSGGILDQDSYLVWGMTLVLNAKVERQKLEEERAKKEGRRHGR